LREYGQLLNTGKNLFIAAQLGLLLLVIKRFGLQSAEKQ
jgi:hypothetical protein